jgi:DNA gyrase/topoisomerase IV subunit A
MPVQKNTQVATVKGWEFGLTDSEWADFGAKNQTNQAPGSSDYLLRDSREYSIYVCSTRAIPAVEDGLKQGQRIALWLLRNRAEKIKTFALSGLMGFERLYVHGEVSANSAIGLLAAPFKNNVCLIEGLGQFGSRVAPVDGIGAPRYTEVRRSKGSEAFLYRDLDLVPLIENYDGSNMQPSHFLPLIPTVLLNGVSGIAVGWSTEILPRSLKSLIQATQDALAGNPIKGIDPYFARYNIDVKNVGTNQWEFTGKVKILDTSTLQITELPPGEKIENFRAKLIKMENGDHPYDRATLGEDCPVMNFVDRSTDCIDITVKFKRGYLGPQAARVEEETIDGKKYKHKIPARKAWTEADAIKFFKLTEKTTERIVVLGWGGKAIRTYASPEELIRDFAAWRLGWYTKRFEKMLADAIYERNFWKAIAALFKDNFPKRLGAFADKAAVETDVMGVVTKVKLKLDDTQLERVVNLPTYRWTKSFEAEVQTKISNLDTSIKEYQSILASPDRLKAVYNDELEELKKAKLG